MSGTAPPLLHMPLWWLWWCHHLTNWWII